MEILTFLEKVCGDENERIAGHAELADENLDPFEALTSARRVVPLDDTHKAIIDELSHSGFSTIWVRTRPPRSMNPTTTDLSSSMRPVSLALRCLCMFRALPPMKVSSTSTSPDSFSIVP